MLYVNTIIPIVTIAGTASVRSSKSIFLAEPNMSTPTSTRAGP